ncbi:bifunctional 4-hydroxy-2-oxoglutarate aldolase/2-dehydro-3-deoxy-phosphogluconate aldolase [Chitinophagaceae bacterium MMS25-I14]
MDRKTESLELVKKQGLLPLYFHPDATVSTEVLIALYSAGIRSVEYTNRGATALENFRQLVNIKDKEMPGLQLGVGTIKNAADAQAFIDAGADYIISPGFVPEAAAVADKAGLLWVPGCMTTTEIIAAEKFGAVFVKLFPGNVLGPGFMSAIKEIFPGIAFMPTGGVDLDEQNIRSWFQAGVCAVGMGSKLVSKQLMDERDYNTIVSQTQKCLQMVASVR